MRWLEYKDMIDSLFSRIEIIECTESQFGDDSDCDYSSIYDDLKVIMLPTLDYFSSTQGQMHRKVQKVYYVALYEMVREDFNRGMVLTYKFINGTDDIDINKYYSAMRSICTSQNIKLDSSGKKYEKAFIEKTGIPRNLTTNVIKMFKIYWKYFRHLDVQNRQNIFFSFLKTDVFEKEYIIDGKDMRDIKNSFEDIKDYPETVIKVFKKLDLIYSSMDEYGGLLEDKHKVYKIISQKLGFDITKVLRNKDLENFYSRYISEMTIDRFWKLIFNLNKDEIIIFPDKTQKKVSHIVKNDIICGQYRVRNNKYDVLIDPTVSLDKLQVYQYNSPVKIAFDKYLFKSVKPFEVQVGEILVDSSKICVNNNIFYAWIGRIPAASFVVINGVTLYSSDFINYNISIKKKYYKDENISKLQYDITNLRVGDRKFPYGNLNVSINGKNYFLISLNKSGTAYVADVSKSNNLTNDDLCVNSGINNIIEFKIDNKVIASEKVVLEENYLFDKWNGDRLYSNKENKTHTDSVIYYSKSKLESISEDYIIEKQYETNGYYCYEIKVDICDKLLHIDDDYTFLETKKAYFSIKDKNNNIIQDYVSFADLNVEIVHFNNLTHPRLSIEKGNISKQVAIHSSKIHLQDVFQINNEELYGEWIVSLWDEQEKVQEGKFSLFPYIKTRFPGSIMEDKELFVELSASEPVFLQKNGTFTSNISKSLGIVELNISPDAVTSNIQDLCTDFRYCVDKYNIFGKVYCDIPVWGVRCRKNDKEFWKKQKEIRLDLADNNEIAIISTHSTKLKINNKNITSHPGITLIKPFDYFEIGYEKKLEKKNVIQFNDSQNTLLITFTCTPCIELIKDIYHDEEKYYAELQYYGPVKCNLRIQLCANRIVKQVSFRPDSCKDVLRIELGRISELENKYYEVGYFYNDEYHYISSGKVPGSLNRKIDIHSIKLKDLLNKLNVNPNQVKLKDII